MRPTRPTRLTTCARSRLSPSGGTRMRPSPFPHPRRAAGQDSSPDPRPVPLPGQHSVLERAPGRWRAPPALPCWRQRTACLTVSRGRRALPRPSCPASADWAASDPVPAWRLTVVITTEQVRLADYTTLRLGGPAARFVAGRAARTSWSPRCRAADAEPSRCSFSAAAATWSSPTRASPAWWCWSRRQALELRRDGDAVDVTAAAGQDWDEFVQRCVGRRAVRGRVPVRHSRPGRRHADPERECLRPGGRRDDHLGARLRPAADDQVVQLPAADCGFGYRTSVFKRQAAAAARGADAEPGVGDRQVRRAGGDVSADGKPAVGPGPLRRAEPGARRDRRRPGAAG